MKQAEYCILIPQNMRFRRYSFWMVVLAEAATALSSGLNHTRSDCLTGLFQGSCSTGIYIRSLWWEHPLRPAYHKFAVLPIQTPMWDGRHKHNIHSRNNREQSVIMIFNAACDSWIHYLPPKSYCSWTVFKILEGLINLLPAFILNDTCSLKLSNCPFNIIHSLKKPLLSLNIVKFRKRKICLWAWVKTLSELSLSDL